MPRFHLYQKRHGGYVLTSISGAVITFQLTSEGLQKLKATGVQPEQRFPRGLLLDLYRTGNAYTGGSGVEEPATESLNQLALDFAQDPDPETLFPSCEDCTSVEDLHLSLVSAGTGLAAKLQCPRCRKKTLSSLDTCVPLPLLSLSLLGRLFRIREVTRKHDSVSRFERLLELELESKWEELRKHRRSSQKALFEVATDELKLNPPRRKSPRKR